MDVSMPVLDGIEATRILRKTDPAAKIVFLTVDGSLDLQQAALETGALGYVLKMRMGSDLQEAIRHALAGRQFISPMS
jgi:DNA-binding NarL/FixJ family response regulator